MADKEKTIEKIDFEVVTIVSGGTDSAAVDLRGMTLCGIYIPSTLTSTSITFKASDEFSGTYIPVFDGLGSELSKIVASTQYIVLNPSDFAGIQYLKIVTGSLEGADREIKLALRQV